MKCQLRASDGPDASSSGNLAKSRAIARAVGVAAMPPSAVSRKGLGKLLPTRYIASNTSSGGMGLSCPARAISALMSAFALWLALRKLHGNCTSPATGSHTSPMQFTSTMAAAWAHMEAVPRARVTAAAAAIAAAVPHSA